MAAVDRVSFKGVLTEAKDFASGKSKRDGDDEIRYDENTGAFSIENPSSEKGMLVVEMKNGEHFFGDDLKDCDPEEKTEDAFARKDGKTNWIEQCIERVKEVEA